MIQQPKPPQQGLPHTQHQSLPLPQSFLFPSPAPLPSTAILFFVYHLVWYRPIIPEDLAVEYFEKLQDVQNYPDPIFYLHLWISALTGLAEACAGGSGRGFNNIPVNNNSDDKNIDYSNNLNSITFGHSILWKSFVLLPLLIEKLESRKTEKSSWLEKDDVQMEEVKNRCHESVIDELFGFTGLISACNKQVVTDINSHDTSDNNMIQDTSDISVDILKVCLKRHLVRREFVVGLLKDRAVELEWEGMDATDPHALAVTILDNPVMINHLEVTLPLYLNHESSVETIMKLISTWCTNKDIQLQPLAMLCRILIQNTALLDLVLLYRHPAELLMPLEKLCNSWDKEASSSSAIVSLSLSTADNGIDSYKEDYENFGIIFLLIITVITRYDLHTNISEILLDKQGFVYTWLHQPSITFSLESLDNEHRNLVSHWNSFISSSNNDDDTLSSNSIPDDLLKESSPRSLIQLSPTIFQQRIRELESNENILKTITARESEPTENTPKTMLMGFNLFLEPCCSFCLIGALQWLCNDALLKGQPSISLEVIKSLLSSSSYEKIPSVIKSLVGPHILDVLRKPAYMMDTEIASITEKIRRNLAFNPDSKISLIRFQPPPIHHFENDLFREVLQVGGPHVFVRLIFEEVLSASKYSISLRAAELGASLLMTQLTYSNNPHLHPSTLILLFTETLASTFTKKIESYAQGFTLGLLSMHVLLRTNAFTVVVGDKTLYEHFRENVLNKTSNVSSRDDNNHEEDSFKVPKYSPVRGFADGLLSHVELLDKAPELLKYLKE
ncbi:5293_t:CDS:10 [Ambispora leptoticha]|uniref:Mediator of RNA polymerase II transcription subunit 5 n=1 Tax=Ambispora leptoticha TaxID=144679 RepID=A0A9N9A0C9_9GLOM|nr:5293_t:CDS:10 [Ambispora leptoticha]